MLLDWEPLKNVTFFDAQAFILEPLVMKSMPIVMRRKEVVLGF